MIGTGMGAQMTGAQERAERARIESDYAARLKAGYPCGTHTLFRKRPSATDR